ncbi:MAG: hypothetical protein DHS20C11_29560 [Lysobacteraceae bacterium]|nr:MAG: hypothetical protein DHS20C11_29560 [Xanthomonadaceae bacterium]
MRQAIPLLALSALITSACDQTPTAAVSTPNAEKVAASVPKVEPAQQVNQLADRYYEQTLSRTPETAYFAGLEIDRHDGMEDNSPEARKLAREDADALLAQLIAIDADRLVGSSAWITHAYLLQALGAQKAQRVCRTDLWNVNQMGGWHSAYGQIAQLQPTGSEELRQQSLIRWAKLPKYIDQEIAYLRQGLAAGYSAPKAVVQRVIDQVDGLLALEIEQSPFYSPAARDDDEAFASATGSLVADQINPAFQRYRDYLAGPYMAEARETLSVTANPDGLACYEASLRGYTTLDRSGKEVYELGQQTVAANKEAVIELGKLAYGLDDFGAIIAAAKADPADRFDTADELLQFSKDAVLRAAEEMPKWVGTMPQQPVEVVPFAEHEEGTGRSAHYRPAGPDRPGEYRIPLYQPEQQSRGNAEATAFHETWPGHHLQVAVGQSVEGLHPVTRIIWFSGPGEGWARYSESLADEMGLYQTKTGPIRRRAWPARGMVVDPGLHLFGWTREQAIEFMNESGRFPDARGDEMVDRIAILPGQLTAYDSGGLEILALRGQAEQALGDGFDIREFHDRVLENGTVPLKQLRAHIEAWIATKVEAP